MYHCQLIGQRDFSNCDQHLCTVETEILLNFDEVKAALHLLLLVRYVIALNRPNFLDDKMQKSHQRFPRYLPKETFFENLLITPKLFAEVLSLQCLTSAKRQNKDGQFLNKIVIYRRTVDDSSFVSTANLVVDGCLNFAKFCWMIVEAAVELLTEFDVSLTNDQVLGLPQRIVDHYRAMFLYMSCRYREMVELSNRALRVVENVNANADANTQMVMRALDVVVEPRLVPLFDDDIVSITSLMLLYDRTWLKLNCMCARSA